MAKPLQTLVRKMPLKNRTSSCYINTTFTRTNIIPILYFSPIVIRWHLQMNGCLVTKSVTPSRIEGNFNVWDFELSPEDMNLFNDLNVGWRHLLWAETSVHADYPFKDYLPND